MKVFSDLSRTFTLLFTLYLGITSCSNPEQLDLNPLNVSVTHPVPRNWQAIKASKTLRMITRYNSISYFMHNGVEKGFEYDFLKAFAKEHNLELQVVIAQEHENVIDLLNSGAGDVIAANYSITPNRKKYIDFTEPYNRVNQVIVLNQDVVADSTSNSYLSGLTLGLRRRTSYVNSVKEFTKSGVALNVKFVDDYLDTEALLLAVSNHEFDATIADDNLLKAAQCYIPGLVKGPNVSQKDSVAWAIRSNNPELKMQLNKFINQHYRISEDDSEKRSAFLNILTKKYFDDDRRIFAQKTAIFESKYSGVLSPFDELIKPIADSAGIDWKMVVSIAAQESRFDPNARSWAGAIGLMQINHRFSKYSEQELYNPEINVREAVRILNEQLNHYNYLDEKNKWAMVLATYNAGVGHVSDARRIAIDAYKNPNDWKNIEDGLLKLMKKEFYLEARHGYCRGIETVTYVRDVKKRYEMYATLLDMSERAESGLVRNNLGSIQSIQ